MARVEGLKEFLRKIDQVEKAYNKLPNEVAAIAVKFSKDRFRDQAWLDRSREKWKPRASRRPGRRSQTLLVDKGYLKRSIRKISANHQLVVIGSDAAYAEIHNDGGTINKTVTVKQHVVKSHKRKAHTRQRKGRTERIKSKMIPSYSVGTHRRKMNLTIPARPFIGQSAALEKTLIDHMKNRFDKALNK